MHPTNWERIKELFEAAIAKDPTERQKYLDEVCEDPAIRNEVESLLAAHQESFLEKGPESSVGSSPNAGSDAAGSGFVGGSRFLHYRIIKLLGQGGMGSIYLAEDTKLNRMVAIKVLLEELTRDDLKKKRFIQEARAAAAIDHPHIAAVYDIDETDGCTFIAMEYVRGTSLREVIFAGQTDYRKNLEIAGQVAGALSMVHERGLVHRDLKPENILVAEEGYAKIIDFGLAKLIEPTVSKGEQDTDDVATESMSLRRSRTGHVVGTLSYMSPEQARGEHIDSRSDIFSFGIVLYEMLTGSHPFKGANALETMSNILREMPELEIEELTGWPEIQRVLRKSLAKDPENRYQSIKDLALDLHDILEEPEETKKGLKRSWIGLVAIPLLVVILLIGLWWFLPGNVGSPSDALNEPITVLVADFENHTSDPIFEDALEQALSMDLEEAANISCYRRPAARQVAAQIDPAATGGLGENLAGLVGRNQGIDLTVSGTIERDNGGYEIDARVVNTIEQKIVAKASSKAETEDEVLMAVHDVAREIRTKLGDPSVGTSPDSAETPVSPASILAMKSYASAREHLWRGEYDSALELFREAVEQDSKFGLAYAGMATVLANKGERQHSETRFQEALSYIDGMTDRAELRTRGAYFVFTGDYVKATEELEKLVAEYPADSAGHANLALCYFYTRDMKRALEEGGVAVELYSNNVPQRNNLALYAMYAGEFERARREAQKVLEVNPSFEKALVAIALSELGLGDGVESAKTYQHLETTSEWGSSLALMGLADLALYEGRVGDSASILERGIGRDFSANRANAAARKLVTLAHTHLILGKVGLALSAVERALEHSRLTDILFESARVYMRAGQQGRVDALAAELAEGSTSDSRAYSKVLEGEAELARGQAQAAIRSLLEAVSLSDIWWGRFDLGRAYLKAEAFTEAYSELELCLKRRGEVTAVFLDDIPSYRYLPPVYYYFGLAQEGLGSPAAADSFRRFLAIQGYGEESPLVIDARKRLGN